MENFWDYFTNDGALITSGSYNFNDNIMKAGGEIVIYQPSENSSQIEVRMDGDTVWLTQEQIAELFDTDRTSILKHIQNIYKERELDEKSTCAKNAQVRIEGNRRVEREILHYNLDVIIAVGYRASSYRATQFRIWATQRLRDYLIKGYAINEKRLLLSADKLNQVENLIETIKEAQAEGRLRESEGDFVLRLISSYTKAIETFNQIDTNSLHRKGLNENVIYEINYKDAMAVVDKLKKEVEERGESNFRFAKDDNHKVEAAIGAVSQTFGGKYLYPTIEEQAANLLYLIVDGHAFMDGNKRCGSLLFVWFLEKNNSMFRDSGEPKINNSTLILLSFLIAQSKGINKEFYIDLTVNLLSNI